MPKPRTSRSSSITRPKSFVIEDGKLTGMLFDVMEYDLDAKGRITAERVVGEKFFPATT